MTTKVSTKKYLTKPVAIISIIVALLVVYFIFFYDSIQDIPPEFDNIGLEIEPLVFEGRRIHFPYTDENDGESIIIKSDKKVYEGSDRSDVYFTVTNTGDKSEKVAILSYFPKEYGDINYIDVWGDESWQRLPITRGDIKGNMTKLGKAFAKKKPVPDRFDVKAGIQFEISAGHIAYFKAEITYPFDKEGEFWFEAFGDQGGYGLLDPLFVGGGTTIGQTTTSRDTPSGWYNTGGTWDYRRKITVDYKKVSGTSNLANFPVLVSVTYPDLRTTGFSGGKAASGSGEFIFTSSDGTTSLPYEIETYSSSSGQFIGWVNVTTLSVTTDTSIYMYYGGPSAGVATNQNKTGTWNSTYLGVWHLPNGITLSAKDSTSAANNGAITGTIAGAGLIDGAADPDGSGDRILFSDIAAMDFSATSDFTLSGWFNSDLDGADRVIIAKSGGLANSGWVVFTDNTPDDLVIRIQETAADGSATCSVKSATIFNGGNLDKWFHYTFVWDDDSRANTRVYINGVDNTATDCSNIADIGSLATTEKFAIDADSSAVNPFDGLIDEVRVSNVARSADWIKTEYNNQFKPSLFYSIGGLESRTAQTVKIGQTTTSKDTTPGWYSESWTYRKRITIDKNKVSGTSNLSSFPVLISRTDSNFKHTSFGGNVASSSAGPTGGGGDFVFTSSDGTTKIDHEIEKYSSSSGEIIAWVEVPTLSVSADTVLYVYYGGPSTGATNQNKTGTWDTNYKGVWHLPNGTTLTALDSTSNASNGTLTNTPTATTGRVDGAGNFAKASDQYVNLDNPASLQITGNLTVSTWIKLTSAPVGDGVGYQVITKDKDTGGRAYTFDVNNSANVLKARLYINGGAGSNIIIGNTTLSTATWYYIVGVYNTAGTLDIYLNGVSDKAQVTGADISIPSATANALIARREYAGFTEPFDGVIDESRISATNRSADWIATEYTNQFKPSTFYGFGGQQKRN